jgi:hypothetical protein
MAWLMIGLGPALLAVDLHAGMPAMWTWTEGLPVAVIGFAMLYLRRSVPVNEP